MARRHALAAPPFGFIILKDLRITRLLGFFFQHQSYDVVGNIPEEVAQRCIAGYQSGEFEPINFEQVLSSCLEQPFDIDAFPADRRKPDRLSMLASFFLLF
jgi:hypothetical protein